MTQVTYIEFSGKTHTVNVPDGTTAMEAGRDHGVAGIGGDCGGQASCASCHVFVDEHWLPATGQAHHDLELSLLEGMDDFRAASRLACQIRLTQALDGLVLHLPQKAG